MMLSLLLYALGCILMMDIAPMYVASKDAPEWARVVTVAVMAVIWPVAVLLRLLSEVLRRVPR